MTTEQQTRWDNIRNFPIDAPNASFPYSTRLARENGWTPVYAERVIEEYRKFAFLAAAAGHGVTPSKAVDEAWHLHLLYTRNYWDEFCPKALGMPLHHNPADGGAGDDAKYEGWYENTLASYERLFGGPPPGDIWPRGATVEKPTRSRWAFLAVLGLTLAGCSEPANPLDWHGPEFLQLYWMLYLGFGAGALLIRHLFHGPDEGPPAEDWRLHTYEQAYLNGGAQLALGTAITRLTAEKSLEVDRKTGKMTNISTGGPAEHPLDRAILAVTSSGAVRYSQVAGWAKPTLDEMEELLRRQGLWVRREQVGSAMLMPFVVACLPLLLGLAKISVGLSRERPVGFLVLSCFLGLLANLAFFNVPKRSRYGERVLDEIRSKRKRFNREPVSASDEVAEGIALYGMSTLLSTDYAYVQTAITPPATGSGSGGGSSCSSSSCSSSSCSSSSCGGGGCGGGGCGGCGS